ncbi:MAG: DUF4126 domain-containing protein [Planctomycetes bacterium]|nr:DUF4126 domain-containing protein [Planctomycetota bacterium]
MDTFELILSILVGVGLSAACGFRVFVPLLVMSIAAKAGYLGLSPDFEWIASWPALIAFAVATALEIGAYYIPWLDNVLDTAATPIAIVAGVIVSAACVTDINPMLKWALAVVVGGGAAGAVQVLTVTARAAATAATAGLGNAVVATAENLSAAVISVLAVLAPVVAIVCAVAGVVLVCRLIRRGPAAASIP